MADTIDMALGGSCSPPFGKRRGNSCALPCVDLTRLTARQRSLQLSQIWSHGTGLILVNDSTPDRILASALKLFNQWGVDRAPVYKIASDIGISPGNLTYHFPKKQDILRQLIHNLETEAAEALATKRDPKAPEMARYLVDLFRLMWRYHFFFASLTYLTATDSELEESYHRIKALAQNGSSKRIEDAAASGDIPPVVFPSSPQVLAENMWAVWINRLGVNRPIGTDDDDSEAAIYDCCVHHISLIQPYASKNYITRLHTAVKQLLEAGVAPRAAAVA